MKGRMFPPGVGWLPWAAVLVVLSLVSFMTVKPHYAKTTETKVAGGNQSGPYQGAGGPTGAATPGALGPSGSGTGGHYVPGSAGSAGTPGRTENGTGGHYVGGTNGTFGKLPPGADGNLPPATAGIDCAKGQNGGATDTGVTANSINVAATIVTTSIGAGFLGQAQDGMQAAINQVNAKGGICGRQVKLHTLNSGWDAAQGKQDIDGFIHSDQYFALVANPDSEGLDAATRSGDIDAAGIPVVGTDGLLKSQYNDPWIWPVAASTVTNMHVIAAQAVHAMGVTSGNQVGIVFDTAYKFGLEGAAAFNNEMKRLTGTGIPGYGSQGCDSQYCGVNGTSGDFTHQTNQFDSACNNKCKVVVMLLEPQPMEAWMNAESQASQHWFDTLVGGEPLFDDEVAKNCPGCGQGRMQVWTGFHPFISPFSSEQAVVDFCSALHGVAPRDDCHNEFTEGAYLGTRLFLYACDVLKLANAALTRANLRKVLNSGASFDFGLSSAPLKYSERLPHLANTAMAAFYDNYGGSFNGWSYLNTGFVADPDPGKDLQ